MSYDKDLLDVVLLTVGAKPEFVAGLMQAVATRACIFFNVNVYT